jgi:hypothetical protein
VPDVEPHHLDRSFLERQQRVEDPDRGRLARAVRPEQAVYLAALDGEVDAVDCGEVGEAVA